MRKQLLSISTASLLLVACGGTNDRPSTQVGASIYTSAVIEIVIDDLGGGFAPPAPSDAQCDPQQGKYTISVIGHKLSWAQCAFLGDGQSPSYQQSKGSRVLGDDDWKRVEQSLRQLVVAAHANCGADKPLVELTVSTGAGAQLYGDQFYSCLDKYKDAPLVGSDPLDQLNGTVITLASAK